MVRLSQRQPNCVVSVKNMNKKNTTIEFKSNIENDIEFSQIEEWKHKWTPKKAVGRKGSKRDYGHVTYKLISESRSFPDSSFEHKALSIALRTWGLRTKDIRFKRVRGNTNADLVVRFVKQEDDDYLKDKPSVLAYAYFPNGQAIGGDMTFNDSIWWSKNGEPVNAHKLIPETYPPNTKTKLRTYNLIHVMIHEGGHAIGLKHHPTCRECVMFPYYSGLVVLHDKEGHDVGRIQEFYGKRRISDRIIDYFRRRMQRKWGKK